MELKRFFLLASSTVLLTGLQTCWLNFPVTFSGSAVMAQTVEERKAQADKLYQQGNQQYKTSQFQEALQSFQEALLIYRELKDTKGEALTVNYIGLIYRSLSQYPEALKFYRQGLEIFRKLGDRWNEGTALNNIGSVYRSSDQYAQARDFFQQALSIRRKVQDREGEGVTLSNLGTIYHGLGQYSQALELYEQALVIRREVGDFQGEVVTLLSLGVIYYDLGQYNQALETYQQALNVSRKINNKNGEALVLNSMGTVYMSQGDYSKALNLYQQALIIARKIGVTGLEAALLNNIAEFYRYQGQYSQALDFYQQSLVIYRKIGSFGGEETAINNMGKTYDNQGDYSQALKLFQQALTISRKIENYPGEGRILRNMGSNLYQSGKLAEATETLTAGIKALESLRSGLSDSNKVSIFETQASIYRLLQQVFIAQNNINDALEIAERGRARAFVELLVKRLSSETRGNVTSPPPPNIAQITQIAKAQNATLVQYSIIDDDFKSQNKSQVKQTDLYIWVIKPTGEVTFRKVDLKPLQQKNTSLKDLVSSSRDSIGVDERSIFKAEVVNPGNQENSAKSLQQLHQLLISPIADLLPTDQNQRVIFVPQGELFVVPFAALQDKDGKYLIEKHTILSAPSIQVLELTRASREKVKQASAKDAIIIGNPTMPSVAPKIGEKPQQLASLPGAKREAEEIAPLLNTNALTGNAATKTAVLSRISQARIVHLATHGLFDDFQGLQSAIALAPTSSDRGLLTAEEILNLKLNADLVVLSACNTGRGRITGDGVIGLSRSLFIAGTPSVVVSLWAVPDAPTAELMTEFYTNLYQKKLDKAQSLRMAMLKMMETHRDNPRAWAAFTLIGEAE
ncbi:CHAT domain-containing tetratricopeptide repeat protein [Trichocoleus sp. DQ-A3]|uniref:CHAT domain-containing tetratricopeptide repeat protein n=1 Tax=Cyanophyceae TaxID=3028117 RepID=UPI001689CB6B|nr:CHAT domain-containing tetratricopeptide repeat protein [Coleofasciculus sp. FACHB-125]MBD1902656.1 CHAT domain-containing protein [Coleofasciculus sp. FACHB-125]